MTEINFSNEIPQRMVKRQQRSTDHQIYEILLLEDAGTNISSMQANSHAHSCMRWQRAVYAH
jgi:hypothetical protein